jgi:ATP-binding cassette subfamily B protein
MNKPDKMTLRETLHLSLRGYKLWWNHHPKMLLSVAACAAAEALTPYAGIYLSARILNEIAGARDRDTLIRLVLTALIAAAALALATAALTRWKNYHLAGEGYKRSKFYTDKLLGMDFRDADDARTHALYSQIRQTENLAGWGLSMLLQCYEMSVRALATIAGAVALTVSLFTLPVPAAAGGLAVLNHPAFLAAAVAVMLGITFLSSVLYNKANGYWVRITEESKMGNRYFSFFGEVGTVPARRLDTRIYRQDRISKEYMERDTSFTPTSAIAGYARGPMGGLNAASSAVSHISTGVLYAFVCLKALGGAFGVGSVTQYIGAITALSRGVDRLIKAFGTLRYNAAFLRMTFELLDIPNAMVQGSLTTEKRSDRKYEIEFRNVGFQYPGSEQWALRGVSLKFSIGQRLAVVGQNGSGKTTFIKLLCRLYDPTEGDILLNGIDIRKYDYRQYMDIFSVVFQDFKLLSLGLGQNVAAAAAFDAEKAEDCLIKAGFGERLDTLPKGLDTCLYKEFEEDGVEISGGEAQKIALARALYKDASFLILDEPTAALDPVAEFEVYSRMNEIAGGKTAVFISHRLSSCRFCHDIAVFHEGALIQRGSHDALIAQEQGKYFELWDAQAQYYVSG